MTVRICSHRRSLLPMQSDVLNEQQQLSNDSDTSSSLSTTTLIYSGLKLHPKPLVPTISMPGVASPLSIVKKLSLPDSHLDNSTNNLRHSSTTNSSTPTTPSSIRLVTPTGKSSPPTNLPFQLTDKTSTATTTNGSFSTSKTYILNPQTSSTTTVNKTSTLPNSTSSSLLTLIPPGTTSPKIQTLNSVTISSSTNDMDKSSTPNSNNQSLFLSKNRVTLVQPITTNSTKTIPTVTNNHFWPTQPPQTTPKVFSIPPSTLLPTTTTTAKMISRPVQLIPTSEHHHPHITHIQTVKTEKTDAYPISMHFGLSSPTTNENPYATKNFENTSTHQAYIHMQLLPSTATNNSETNNNSLQFTLPTTHLYSSPSSVLISTTQRSMDHNNNNQHHHHHHHHHPSTITTPIIREMQIDEKINNESSTIKNLHSNKISTKNRTRLPLQPSTQQSTPSSSSSSSTTTTTTTKQPKKHKLTEDEPISSNEPPIKKSMNYEQLTNNSRNRPLSKYSIENTTPLTPLTSSITVDTSGITKKRRSAETANDALSSRKRRTMKKLNHHHHQQQQSVANENIKQDLTNERNNQTNVDINIQQIDDELLKRLSQDFVYDDKQTGIRWIETKTRSKSMSTLVSRFSWKPKINHYEKYSDIIRTNSKRTVPVQSLETLRQKLTEPWATWRVDRLTTYLSDLTHDEQTTIHELSDMTKLLDIEDQSIQTKIEDLFQANIQRHRCFYDQLTQISSVLANLLEHGNTLQDLSKTSTTKRTKDR